MKNKPLSPQEVMQRLSEGGLSLATVSGVLTTRPGMIAEVDRSLPAVGVITTKSYQVKANDGNPEPIIVEAGIGNFGNAVGLRNPGMEQGLQDLRQLRRDHHLRALLNVSISGSSPEEFAALAEGFGEVADLLELNLSCPHAAPGYGMSIGTDPHLVAEYVAAVRAVTDRPLFPKLTPNVADIGEIAIAAIEAGADGISAVNTVGPELYIEAHSGQPILMNQRGNRGGQSGAWIAETALRKVAEIRAAVGPAVPIIGIGGVSTGTDVKKMADAGATIVGLGSVFARVKPEHWRAFTDALLEEAGVSPGTSAPVAGSDNSDGATGAAAAVAGTEVVTNGAGGAVGAGSVSSVSGGSDDFAAAREHKSGSQLIMPLSDHYLNNKRQMEYHPYQVRRNDSGGHDTVVLELEGSLEFQSSQFAFLWLPGIGEKPFSITKSKPLTFFIKNRGKVSSALCKLRAGDTVYARGVYGKRAPITDKKEVYILAGGTGIAVASKLSQELAERGSFTTVYYATSHQDDILVPPGIEAADTLHIIPDEGVPARAVHEFQAAVQRRCDDLGAGENDCALYTIGPPDFMRRAVEAAEKAGFSSSEIYLSVETATHCGVGLCGECECGGHLTCQDGTFFTKGFFDRKGMKIADLPGHSSLSKVGV